MRTKREGDKSSRDSEPAPSPGPICGPGAAEEPTAENGALTLNPGWQFTSIAAPNGCYASLNHRSGTPTVNVNSGAGTGHSTGWSFYPFAVRPQRGSADGVSDVFIFRVRGPIVTAGWYGERIRARAGEARVAAEVGPFWSSHWAIGIGHLWSWGFACQRVCEEKGRGTYRAAQRACQRLVLQRLLRHVQPLRMYYQRLPRNRSDCTEISTATSSRSLASHPGPSTTDRARRRSSWGRGAPTSSWRRTP